MHIKMHLDSKTQNVSLLDGLLGLSDVLGTQCSAQLCINDYQTLYVTEV